MLLLAFDTATPAITVAVHDGTSVVGQAGGEGATAHGEQLAPAIREALAQAGLVPADLTDVAVGVGPGPFTGLRVGVVTALTLGATLGLRTHGVCTLDVLAAEAATGLGEEFLVATDARRREVYWARFAADGHRLEGPAVDLPAVVDVSRAVMCCVSSRLACLRKRGARRESRQVKSAVHWKELDTQLNRHAAHDRRVQAKQHTKHLHTMQKNRRSSTLPTPSSTSTASASSTATSSSTTCC